MSDIVAILLLVILLTNAWRGEASDDTDAPDGKRSGMILYTDHKTVCQYVGTVLGGITPRLGRDGKPICVEPKR